MESREMPTWTHTHTITNKTRTTTKMESLAPWFMLWRCRFSFPFAVPFDRPCFEVLSKWKTAFVLHILGRLVRRYGKKWMENLRTFPSWLFTPIRYKKGWQVYATTAFVSQSADGEACRVLVCFYWVFIDFYATAIRRQTRGEFEYCNKFGWIKNTTYLCTMIRSRKGTKSTEKKYDLIG